MSLDFAKITMTPYFKVCKMNTCNAFSDLSVVLTWLII